MLHSCWEPGLMSIWGSQAPHLGATHAWELSLTLGKEVGRSLVSTWNSEGGCCRQNFVLQMGIWHGHWGEHTDGAEDCQKSFNNHLWTRSQFKSFSSRAESPVLRHSFQADAEQRMPPSETGTISASSTWTWLCLSDTWGVYEHTGSFNCSFFLKQIISCS